MADPESKNHFYLGREHDLASGQTDADAPLLLKSKDLTTHAVCVGMTGSGKTGLCLSLLEEASLDGVPAIAIDPKGDLGNLLLTWPDFDPKEFEKWVDPSVATRKGLSVEEFAKGQAELWETGLKKWNEDGQRIQRFNDSVEKLIFTPGSTAGIQLKILKSFKAPPQEIIDDDELFRERVSSAISGLLALVGIDADPVRSREHIFLSKLLTDAWQEGRDLGVEQMIGEIQSPKFDKVGVMKLDTFFPEKERVSLAMDLNNLLASPSFQSWMEGFPLDIQQLLYNKDGKPRLSIISIAHLDDAQRMFFVTILLNEVLAWMRTQPGTGSLRALLYMDEVYGYFPPVANPPSKQPMLTLLKQARAFGVGCVLATQNPVDLDYKGLSNCGAWFLGRLQTERDKARVIEGLEGASAQAGGGFDKQAMEAKLAALGSRKFLLNNVHDDGPKVFETRWAMSYLAGPLTRVHIKELMKDKKEEYQPKPVERKNDESKEPERKSKKPDSSNEPTQPQEDSTTQERHPRDSAKIAAARKELKLKEYELRQSILKLPFIVVDPLYRLIDLLIAKMNKRATKRRTSSMMSAAGRASTELSKRGKARAAWRKAYVEYQELTGEGKNPPPLPQSAWRAVGILLLLMLGMLGILWLVWTQILAAVTTQPPTP